jgi:DNA polymerase I
MEFDLCPSVTLQTGTFSAVVAPADMFTAALNSNKELQRFMFLYVSGNFSRILTGINRTASTFVVQRAFTAHQLLTILREAHHTIILIEHDPTLFEGTERGMVMAEVLYALRSAAQDAMVILYAPAADSIFHSLAKGADRVFYLAPQPFSGSSGRREKRGDGMHGSRRQTTLEAFNGTINRKQPYGCQDPRGPMEEGNTCPAERRPEVW